MPVKETVASGKPAFSGLLLNKVLYYIDLVEVVLIVIGISAMALLLIANIIARNFFTSIVYVDELIEFLIIFVTFVGMSYAVRKARHIRMGAIFDAMPLRLKKIMIIVICTVGAAVMFLLTFYSFDYVLFVKRMNIVTPALLNPKWTYYAIMPVMFFSSGIHFIRTIIKNIQEKDVWLSPEQQSEYDTVDEYEPAES